MSLLLTAMALQRLQEEKELEQPLPCQPLCSRSRRRGKQLQQTLHTGTLTSAALPGLGSDACLSHQGLLNQDHCLQLILSTAEPGFVVCTFPPHVQQVSSSLRDLLRKTLQGTSLTLVVCVVSLECAVPWSTAVLCVTWPVLICAELCLAEKASSEEMHGLSCSGNEAGCLR